MKSLENNRTNNKVRADRRLPSFEVLYELIINDRLTYNQVALMYDVSGAAIYWATHPEKRRQNARKYRKVNGLNGHGG